MSGFDFKGKFIKLLAPGRQRAAWPGCTAYADMTEAKCSESMHELAGCFLCKVRRREQACRYKAKARQVAATCALTIFLLAMVAAGASALGTSSIWHGKVYSTTRQYGTVKIINESGAVVKTITLKGFPNYTSSIAFGNWSTPSSAGVYTALYNMSSIYGKTSYTRTIQVDSTATVNVDARSMWNYTGTGGRTLTSAPSSLTLAQIEASNVLLKKTGTSTTNQIAISSDNKVDMIATIDNDAMADAVWRRPLGNYTGTGQAGKKLNSLSGGGGSGFVNWSTGADYFATRFGIGPWGGTVGSGDTAVDETFGATQLNPTPLLSNVNGVPTGGVRIRAYLKADYDARSYTVKASTSSLDNGRWANRLWLSHGVAYTIEYTYAGRSSTANITP
jgi:hypothetical protein